MNAQNSHEVIEEQQQDDAVEAAADKPETPPIEEGPPTDEAQAPEGTPPADEAEAGEEPSAESTEVQAPDLDIHHVKRVLEAALLSTTEPLSVQQLRRLFSGQVTADNLRKTLDELREEWSGRAIELTAVASGWRFRVKPEYQEHIDRISHEKPPKYTRAVLETLAIIAYRQPVTRGDIEEIRGVAVSPATLKALEERGWTEVVGHRETPGRPALFATTRKFLDDLNLRSLEELPPLEELQSTLEPQPTFAAIEAESPPQQESLIADEPTTAEETNAESDEANPQGTDAGAEGDDANPEQEPESHAG